MTRGIDGRKGSKSGRSSALTYGIGAVVTAAIVTAWGLYAFSNQANGMAGHTDSMGVAYEKTQDLGAMANAPRSGLPMLVAYPLAMVPDKHIEISEKSYPWITRTLQSGETQVTEKELKEYFAMLSEGQSHYFVVTSADGKANPYSIEFYEASMSPEQYNVKAYKLDVAPEKFITVNLKDQSWLQNLVDESHTWQPVDITSIKALKQISDGGNELNFKVISEDGQEEFYNLRYAGPELSSIN